MGAPDRLGGMRLLRQSILLLDDERQLDQPARDRLVSTLCGELRKELDAALARRVAWKLRNGGGAA